MNMRILRRCRSATIYDDEKNLLCHANIYLDDEENLRLSVPQEFNEKIQETFEVVFFDPVMGLLPCRCQLSEPYDMTEEVVSFQCTVLEQGEQIQTRNDIKVPVEIEIAMRTNGVVGGTLELGNGGYLGVMKDISAGGTYIVSKMWIDKGSRIDFRFEETKIPIELSVEVLRVMELKDDDGNVIYGHGCRFLELNRAAESQVRNFVYQKERELYKNDIW